MSDYTQLEITDGSADILFDRVPDLVACADCNCYFIESAELGSQKKVCVGPDDYDMLYYCGSCTEYKEDDRVH